LGEKRDSEPGYFKGKQGATHFFAGKKVFSYPQEQPKGGGLTDHVIIGIDLHLVPAVNHGKERKVRVGFPVPWGDDTKAKFL